MNDASPGPQHDLEPHVVAPGDFLEAGERFLLMRVQLDAERCGALVDDAAHIAAAQHPSRLEYTGTRYGVTGSSSGASSPRRSQRKPRSSTGRYSGCSRSMISCTFSELA